MENLKRPFSKACLLFILLSSCSKHSTEVMLPATRSSNDPSPSLMSGTWTISSYAQRTEDKTSSFTGYSFLFKSGGVLEAWVNGTATAASWTYTPAAVTYYGTNSSNASVTISFGPAALNRLNRRWNIDSVHTSAARLALVNPEPRDNEHLDFSKQ